MFGKKLLMNFCRSISKPPNPTIPFGLVQKPPDNLINPKGFIPEKEMENYEEIKLEGLKEGDQNLTETINGKILPKEIGFKYKGPEPTKFGDWSHKGRCTDF